MPRVISSFMVETKKFFHSKVPFMTLMALLLIPFIGGFFMFILKDPDMARRMGVVSAKAQIAGDADWPTYLGLLSQAISIGGIIVFGFVMSWVFGREYSDRTIKDLLALPTSRITIVVSKFYLVFIWCFMLSLLIFTLGLLVGNFIDIPGKSSETLFHGFSTFTICSILTILLSSPVALFASIGRGYLSPLGFVVFTLVLAQIVAAAGYGEFFPWAVPALASGVAGNEHAMLEGFSIIIVIITSIIGFSGTILWWRFADQK